MRPTQFNLLDVLVSNFQSFGGSDSSANMLSYTDDQWFRNAEHWKDFAWFRVDEPPIGDIGDLRSSQLVRILWLQEGLQKRCVVPLWELQLENQGVCLPSNGLLKVSDRVFHQNQADLVVVYTQ
jgi:hypothetical protein